MPTLIEYLVKLSVSLAVVWLFYQFVLRRLTFYNHNRWYLLGYSLLSLVIPFIDITPALHKNELVNSGVVQWVPLIYNQSTAGTSLSIWNMLSFLIVAGMVFMLIRLLVQLVSFRRMMKKATLISGNDVQLYQVNESIIPFSFGNAVFFNVNLHTTEELEKIIRHEFVHVKQRHSIDIIFSEILCLINWYNPFAWMIRAAIRQNLEFVADNNVLENGINKKQYQYLLLKVIGNDQFSIAQKFNFSSLKKRIAMMNKNKSAKKHLLRFLFLLPVLAVILISFRREIGDTLTGKQKQLQPMPVTATDTVPEVTKPNSKGYIINVKDQKGECLLVIKDKTGKEVKRLLLTEWNANAEKFEANYGEIPPPPISVAPPDEYLERTVSQEDFLKRNTTVKNVGWVFNNLDNTVAVIQVFKKDGTQEKYNLNNKEEAAQFEKKYGELPYPPPPPPPPASSYDAPAAPGVFNYPAPPQPPAAPTPIELPDNVQKINITNNKATVTLKNGQKENYDLNNAEQKAKFKSKYGESVPQPPAPPVKVEIREVPAAVSVEANVQVQAKAERANVVEVSAKTSIPALQGNPLIIVDGVIIKNGELDNINPNSISSINILKGKDAVAAYGEKGSNGVIVIKTKASEKVKPITQTPFLFQAVKNDGC